MVDVSRQAGVQIYDAMIEAAAREICESGITPYPRPPRSTSAMTGSACGGPISFRDSGLAAVTAQRRRVERA